MGITVQKALLVKKKDKMTLKARINAFNIFYIDTCMEFFIFFEVTRGAIMLLYAHYHIQGHSKWSS